MNEFLEAQEYKLEQHSSGVYFYKLSPKRQWLSLLLILVGIPFIIVLLMNLMIFWADHSHWFGFAISFIFFTCWLICLILSLRRKYELKFYIDVVREGISIPKEGLLDFGGFQDAFVKTRNIGGYASPFESGNTSYIKTMVFLWYDLEIEVMDFYSRQEELEEEIVQVKDYIMSFFKPSLDF